MALSVRSLLLGIQNQWKAGWEDIHSTEIPVSCPWFEIIY